MKTWGDYSRDAIRKAMEQMKAREQKPLSLREMSEEIERLKERIDRLEERKCRED
jgi:polyhydroxyalkanoate synthesis regulator phasin